MRTGALVASLAGALALLAFAPALDASRQLAARDLFHLFYPLGKLVAQGGFVPPARDLGRGLGVGLVGDPLAWSFYPGRALHLVGGYDVGFKLALIAHAALAGVAAFVLARALGAGRRAALLALVGATLAGPVISLHRHPNLLAAAAWAPLVVAGLLRALDAEGRAALRPAALAAGALALMLLAGGVEMVLGLSIVLAALALAGRPLGRRVAILGLVVGLGAALAAIQLAPTLHWVRDTLRPGAVSAAAASEWSLPVARLPALALRSLDAGERSPYGPFAPSVHLGVVVVLLALRSLLRGDRRARALGVALVLVGWASLGAAGGLFTLLRAVPVFDRFRYPEKLLLVVAVLAPALAARSLHDLRRPLVALALVAFTTFELIAGSGALVPTVPARWLRDPPATVALVGSGRVFDVGVPGSSSFEGTVARHRESLLGGLPGLYGGESAVIYGPFPPVRLVALLRATEARGAFADLACVTGVISGPHSPLAGAWPSSPAGDLVVLHAPGGPRARLVFRAHRATFEQAGLAVATGTYRRVTPFEGDLPDLDGHGDGTATLVERTPDSVRVETDASAPALLVLSELWSDAARARVDGHEAPCVCADLALVGVPVPAGEHEVLVAWTTPGLREGAMISGIALAIWISVIVSSTAKRNHGGTENTEAAQRAPSPNRLRS